MAELVMRKRGAMHAGELGLFIDAEVFEDEFASIKQGADISVTATQSRSLKQLRMAWALAATIAKSGALGDADQRDVMNYLLKKAKHVRYIFNKHSNGEEMEIVVKSIRFHAMDQDPFNRLFNRMIYIVLSEILPDMPEGDLRAKVEKMAGIGAVEEVQPKPERKQRKPRAPIEPISVIPPREEESQQPDQSAPIPATTEEVYATSSEEDSRKIDETVPDSGRGQVQFSLQPFYNGKFNVAEWTEWTKAWLMAALIDMNVTDQDVITRWGNERALRNECGVTTEDRQPMFDLYGRTLERIRNRRKS